MNEILNKLLKKYIKDFEKIIDIKPVSGGCISQAVKAITNVDSFFIKWNSASQYPGMFEAEIKGLQLLRFSESIRIPKVIFTDVINDTSFLALEWIEQKNKKNNFSENFGRSLAQMHKSSVPSFGLNHDNYIGSLKQSNNKHSTWIDFFINERLMPQIKLANDLNKIDNKTIKQFDKLFLKLNELFPDEPPALLHGDLWNGNVMADEIGDACLFDPAVYYGHREIEIAMTRLFGGFDHLFYEAYNEEFPLNKNWENRVDICNLYPLMVHVNLFGGSYLNQVKQILVSY